MRSAPACEHSSRHVRAAPRTAPATRRASRTALPADSDLSDDSDAAAAGRITRNSAHRSSAVESGSVEATPRRRTRRSNSQDDSSVSAAPSTPGRRLTRRMSMEAASEDAGSSQTSQSVSTAVPTCVRARHVLGRAEDSASDNASDAWGAEEEEEEGAGGGGAWRAPRVETGQRVRAHWRGSKTYPGALPALHSTVGRLLTAPANTAVVAITITAAIANAAASACATAGWYGATVRVVDGGVGDSNIRHAPRLRAAAGPGAVPTVLDSPHA